MNNSGFRIAIALLAVVGGVVGYLMYQDRQAPATPAPSENKVFSGDLPHLSRVTLRRAGEEPLTVVADGAESWRIVEPASYKADYLVVGELTGSLRTLEAERVLDGDDTDSSAYGLESPMLRITLHEGEQTRELRIGAMNPTGSTRYAQRDDSRKLYLLRVADVNALNKSIGDLRQKRALAVSEPRVKRIVIESPGGNRELIRTPRNLWTFAGMEGFRADPALMNQLATSLVSIRSDASALNGDPLPDTRFRAFPLTARLLAETDEATHEAELRKAPDGTLFASSPDLGGSYPVQSDLEQMLAKPPDDYRNLRLFDFGFADVFRLRYNQVGKRDFTITKPNQDWQLSGGGKLDAAKANKLVDELRSAIAAEFRPGEAPGAATHIVEVEIADGSKETVEIRKAPEASFAVRTGESGYYRVPETFLPDLEKAAGEIQP